MGRGNGAKVLPILPTILAAIALWFAILMEIVKLQATRTIHVETHQNNRNTTISDNDIRGSAYTEELKGSVYTEGNNRVNTDN